MTNYPSHADQFRDDLLKWAERNVRDFPWREPNRSLYEVFIAEFFLTQTPAPRLRDVYPGFVEKYPDLTALREVEEDELANDIQPLGFQNRRASALCEIASTYDELPRDADELRDLQGVGDYVANATICFALHEPLVVYDRNVARVYERVFSNRFPEKRRKRVEFAEGLVPEGGDDARTYNLALLDFGAEVCTDSDPKCDQCFASEYCVFFLDEGTTDESSR